MSNKQIEMDIEKFESFQDIIQKEWNEYYNSDEYVEEMEVMFELDLLDNLPGDRGDN